MAMERPPSSQSAYSGPHPHSDPYTGPALVYTKPIELIQAWIEAIQAERDCENNPLLKQQPNAADLGEKA